jgi:transcriptional regulator with XRE-family HTH domain
MSLAANIKKIREDKGLRQKEVSNAIDMGYTSYNKVENGSREISVSELQRLANYYNTTVDQILNLDNNSLPQEVIIEDKDAQEQLRLISDLDQDDRAIIFKMIDKMLTSKKFKLFFKENVQAL